MVSRRALEALKKSFTIKEYPVADRNAHLMRLIWQSMPYYFSRSGFSFSPLSVFIHINTRCNLKCRMCDAGQDIQDSVFYKSLKGVSDGEMPISSFKTIIDKVKHFKPFIGMPAIEPLFYSHIVEAIEYISQHGLRSSIATNGIYLGDSDIAEGITRAGLTKVIISIDGPEHVHDKIRGIPGTYKKVIEGIEKLVKIKKRLNKREPYIFVNYVMTEDNYSVLEECVDELPMELIEYMNLSVMFYCTQERAQMHNKLYGEKYEATAVGLYGGINLGNMNIDVLHEQMLKAMKKYEGKCRFPFHYSKEDLRKYYHNAEDFIDSTRCVFPWYTIQIDKDGNVMPRQRCYRNLFGNILEQGFDEIWNGKKMRDFRKDLKKYGRFPACARCGGVNL
jgi:MoaA/NifB/PqqE/SkfB family radical SAM enzyme